jgi:diguanylate cyclase (GGDEF)-like protein/PAS domain S-box-containing protein
MIDHWQSLLANLAVVALFISGWVNAQFLFAGKPRLWRTIGFGLTMGVGTVATMLLAVHIQPGYFYDLRTSLIAVTAFFGGPIAALIAVALASGFRVMLGGDGIVVGIISIAVAALIGLVVSRLTRGRTPALASVGILAGSVALATAITIVVLQAGRGTDAVASIGYPAITLGFAATAISAFFIMQQRVLERERDLLRAGFEESPDFQFVKAPDSRFVAVNSKVAKFNGFVTASQLIGKSDFDITDPDRARKLIEGEKQIVTSGRPMIGVEEMLRNADGTDSWFSTSKVALHNADGEVIGLAGVTRDVTARKLLESELVMSRNQLSYVLAEIVDGIAMFDPNGVLLYCNERYRQIFPRTAEVRRPGVNVRRILRAVAESGEQDGIPSGADLDEWIEKVVEAEAKGSEQEVNLRDGRWLQLKTRPTSDGSVLVVVTDVTRTKRTEEALRAMTEQLKMLATTDGLTGLANRRAFDMALESEIDRARRDKTPLALLMIDVDRFKSYNDIYGHQAGDAALQAVGRCLQQTLKRPADTAARYGGEEFVAILAGTDEDGAFVIADEFHEALRTLAIPHKGGMRGLLTASVGLAGITEVDAEISAKDLVRRADKALYDAKGAGRDRVRGWRERHDVTPFRGARA